jgi:hypothetical protein
MYLSKKKKPLVSEAGASSILFICNKRVSFRKDYILPSEFSRWKKAHFVHNGLIQLT